MIKINLNDSVGAAVLEHFINNSVFRNRIDVVRDNETYRGRVKVIPKRHIRSLSVTEGMVRVNRTYG